MYEKILNGYIGKYILNDKVKNLENSLMTVKPIKASIHNFKKIKITIQEIK